MRPSTLRRADVVRQQQAVDDILKGLEQLRKKNDTSTFGIPSSLGFLITMTLPSKGTNTNTSKITQFTQGNARHSKVNVRRNDSRSEYTPSPAYFS